MTKLENDLYQLSENKILDGFRVRVYDDYLTINVKEYHENDIEVIVDEIEDVIDNMGLNLGVEYEGNRECNIENLNLMLGDDYIENRTELEVIFCDR